MVTTTLVLSGIDMSEDEYLESLLHSKRLEFTNGVPGTRSRVPVARLAY